MAIGYKLPPLLWGGVGSLNGYIYNNIKLTVITILSFLKAVLRKSRSHPWALRRGAVR